MSLDNISEKHLKVGRTEKGERKYKHDFLHIFEGNQWEVMCFTIYPDSSVETEFKHITSMPYDSQNE